VDVRSVVRTEDEESEAQLVELLSRGLDFKLALGELEDDEDADKNPMEGRVQGLAGALVGNLKGADEDEKRVHARGLLTCAAQLPAHAPLLGVVVALMTTFSPAAAAFAQSVASAACAQVFSSLGSARHREDSGGASEGGLQRLLRAKLLLQFLSALLNAGALKADGPTGLGPAVLLPLVQRVGGCNSGTAGVEAAATQFERDQFALLVLSVLPSCGEALGASAWRPELEACLDTIALHMENRTRLFSFPTAASSEGEGSEEEVVPLCSIVFDNDEDDEDDDEEEEQGSKQALEAAKAVGWHGGGWRVVDNLEALWMFAQELRARGFKSPLLLPTSEEKEEENPFCLLPRCWIWHTVAEAVEALKEDGGEGGGVVALDATALPLASSSSSSSSSGVQDDKNEGASKEEEEKGAAKGEASPTKEDSPALPADFALFDASQASLLHPLLEVFDSRCGGGAKHLVGLDPWQRLVLKELCADTLAAFKPVVRWNGLMQGTMETAASQLLSLKLLLDPTTTKSSSGGGGDFRSEFLVVEVVLPLALAAPPPTSQALHACGGGGHGNQGCLVSGGGSAYLGRMLLEICKLDKSACDAIAVAVEVVYQRLDSMDCASALRVAELFAHHLGNTKFRWPFWQRWASALEDNEDDGSQVSSERRFLRHTLSVAAHLNHSSARLTQLLASIEASLPPTIAELMPPPLVPHSKVLFPTTTTATTGSSSSSSSGGGMADEGEEGAADPSELSAEVYRVAREVRDRVRMQLEQASKRRFLVADGTLADPSTQSSSTTVPMSSDAELVADFVERQQTETAAEVESGRKPAHWRLTAFAHGLLAAGAAAEVDLALTYGHTLALVDAHAPLLRRLLLSSSSSVVAGGGGGGDDDDGDVMGMMAALNKETKSAENKEEEGSATAAEAAAEEVAGSKGASSGGEDPLGAYGCLLDCVVSVWGSASEAHASSLVLALCHRRLVPPDKVLAWMGAAAAGTATAKTAVSAGTGETGAAAVVTAVARAGPLSFASAATSHASLLLVGQLLAAAPSYYDNVSAAAVATQQQHDAAKEYLGDCAVSALDRLQTMSLEQFQAKDEKADDDEEDDEDAAAALVRKSTLCLARAVVRSCLAARRSVGGASASGGAHGGGLLLDAEAAASVRARVLGDDTPREFREALAQLETGVALF